MLRNQSQTRSSSQFFADSGPSISENSDSVGEANDWLEATIAGALRLDERADEEDTAARLDDVDPRGAGKGVFEANIAMVFLSMFHGCGGISENGRRFRPSIANTNKDAGPRCASNVYRR
jgi:hypothetical protein